MKELEQRDFDWIKDKIPILPQCVGGMVPRDAKVALAKALHLSHKYYLRKKERGLAMLAKLLFCAPSNNRLLRNTQILN